MDWKEYKRLCERPDHFSRWALQVTAAAISDVAARQRLQELMHEAPIAKPPDHRGGEETDFFRVDVAPQHVAVMVRELGDAAASSDDRLGRRLRHLKVVWQEYANFAGSG